jgi:hypothetical protein
MNNISTSEKPLSFRFTRAADDTERLFIYRLFNSRRPLKREMAVDGIVSAVTGVFSFVLFAPFLILGIYGVQYVTGTTLIFDNMPFYFVGGWCCIYIFYQLYRQIYAKTSVIKQLERIGDDFKSGMVIEEAWRFIDAVAYHAPESEKRYYLVTADTGEKLFFHEELIIGRLRRQDDADFSAAPIDMVIIRGQKSEMFIRGFTSGPALPVTLHKTLQGEVPEHGAIVVGGL